MTLQEFKNYVPDFDESIFITKTNNMFIKYFSSIMLDKLDTVKHFVSENLYQEGLNKINMAKQNNYRQMYDMLNVKSSYIKDYIIEDNQYKIIVYLESRYLNYTINLTTGQINGNDKNRIQVNYELELIRKKDVKEQSIARICPGCGASINVNDSGKCLYCGATYNLEDYDWIINTMKEI